MTNNGFKCFHQYVRNPYTNERIGVIVVQVNTNTGAAKIGWSKCNPKDRYNRHLGMSIAVGRMEKSDWINPKNPSDQQKLIDRMHTLVADAWLYDGVFNRVMLMISKNESSIDRVPISQYVGDSKTSSFDRRRDDYPDPNYSGIGEYRGRARRHLIDEDGAPFDDDTDARFTDQNDPAASGI